LEVPFVILFSEETSAMEAVSNGAVSAVHLTIAVVANLIVFVAILAFLNATIAWLGSLIGQNEWSLEVPGYRINIIIAIT
jgi:nucleoside permease NupC